jgi:hypothetical protein
MVITVLLLLATCWFDGCRGTRGDKGLLSPHGDAPSANSYKPSLRASRRLRSHVSRRRLWGGDDDDSNAPYHDDGARSGAYADDDGDEENYESSYYSYSEEFSYYDGYSFDDYPFMDDDTMSPEPYYESYGYYMPASPPSRSSVPSYPSPPKQPTQFPTYPPNAAKPSDPPKSPNPNNPNNPTNPTKPGNPKNPNNPSNPDSPKSPRRRPPTDDEDDNSNQREQGRPFHHHPLFRIACIVMLASLCYYVRTLYVKNGRSFKDLSPSRIWLYSGECCGDCCQVLFPDRFAASNNDPARPVVQPYGGGVIAPAVVLEVNGYAPLAGDETLVAL